MSGSRRAGGRSQLGSAGSTSGSPPAAPARRRLASIRGGRPALLVNATELLRAPGTRQHISEVALPGELGIEHAAITGDVVVEVDLESSIDDIGLTGTVDVPRYGQCRRCLKPVAETITIDIDERYADEPRPDDDAFPISNGQLDLRTMVRDEVLLALEEGPLCRSDCPGLCPICGRDVSIEPCACDATLVDERWAILDQLRDDA